MSISRNPPYYYVWAGMKDRCYNQNNKQFADYGGRGITVCDRWKNNYAAFAEDMGERPAGYSIDRINNDFGYSPENCRWADRRTQQRNQRRAVFVTIEGIQYRAIELAERAGLKTDTIVSRGGKNLTLAEVLSPQANRDLSGLALGGASSGRKKRQAAHCKHGHEFTAENTRITPEGYRACRQCHNAKMRKRNAVKREQRG